jgi:ABC-2 type transport system ATP-binding protein
MTAMQNLALVCKIKGISEEKIEEKLELVGLIDRKNSKFRNFSLGMKQRLAIASALLNDPEILILDEPTNGLDTQGINQIRDVIKHIAAQGTTILLASHLLDEVEKVCSHVVILRNGKKLYDGRVDEMNTSYGYIELKVKSVDEQKLMESLKSFHGIENVKQEDSTIIATLSQDIEASTINKFLFEKGIVVSHLHKRKPTLEQKFLDLTS